VTVSHLQEYVRSIFRFWLPDRRNAYIQLAQRIAITGLLLGGGTLGVSHAIRQKKSPSAGTAMELLAVLYFITYTLFLFVSISFFDALTPTDERIVYPIGVMALIGIVIAFWNTPRLTRNLYARWGFVALLCVLAFGNVNRTVALARHYHTDGTGYTNRAWYNSETIAYIRSLPAESLIYASDPPAILFHTGRQAASIPSRTNPVTLAVNADFGQEIEAMRDDIAQKDALVIVFDSTDGQWFMPTQQELEGTYGFQVLRQFQDGVVYGH
jgi:hypothetical protein